MTKPHIKCKAPNKAGFNLVLISPASKIMLLESYLVKGKEVGVAYTSVPGEGCEDELITSPLKESEYPSIV
jgi:hypothetical protein